MLLERLMHADSVSKNSDYNKYIQLASRGKKQLVQHTSQDSMDLPLSYSQASIPITRTISAVPTNPRTWPATLCFKIVERAEAAVVAVVWVGFADEAEAAELFVA